MSMFYLIQKKKLLIIIPIIKLCEKINEYNLLFSIFKILPFKVNFTKN